MRRAFVPPDELRLILIAVQFLTRLPVPRSLGYEPALLNRAVRHFPLVGLLVGAASAAVGSMALVLWPPAVAATLTVATALWLTAAFHEDGLADTFDALLGSATRQQALVIMKDPHIGAWGAAALALVLIARILLLAELMARDAVLATAAWMAAHGAGRAVAVAVMAVLPYAGDPAHAKARPLAMSVRPADAAWAAFTGALAIAAAALFTPAPVAYGAAAAGGVAVLALLVCRWLRQRLGGYTGDALGAVEQLGEVSVLLALAATL